MLILLDEIYRFEIVYMWILKVMTLASVSDLTKICVNICFWGCMTVIAISMQYELIYMYSNHVNYISSHVLVQIIILTDLTGF